MPDRHRTMRVHFAPDSDQNADMAKVRVEPKGDIAAKPITQDIRRRPMILNLEEFV